MHTLYLFKDRWEGTFFTEILGEAFPGPAGFGGGEEGAAASMGSSRGFCYLVFDLAHVLWERAPLARL